MGGRLLSRRPGGPSAQALMAGAGKAVVALGTGRGWGGPLSSTQFPAGSAGEAVLLPYACAWVQRVRLWVCGAGVSMVACTRGPVGRTQPCVPAGPVPTRLSGRDPCCGLTARAFESLLAKHRPSGRGGKTPSWTRRPTSAICRRPDPSPVPLHEGSADGGVASRAGCDASWKFPESPAPAIAQDRTPSAWAGDGVSGLS